MRKIIPVVAAGATTLALAGTTFGYANLNKDVTLSIDGQTSHVRTSADSVSALLKSKGIEVNGHDVVAPNMDAKVEDGTRVAVKFGRQVTFTIDGEQQTVWTTRVRPQCDPRVPAARIRQRHVAVCGGGARGGRGELSACRSICRVSRRAVCCPPGLV